MTPIEKFEEWFAKPLTEIENLKGCDAAFVALMISFGLFERLIKSDLKNKGIKATPDVFKVEAAKTLRIDQDLFGKFWGMYRDGIQHFLQPRPFRSGGIRYEWVIASRFKALPEIYDPEDPTGKVRVIRICPWKWSKLVLSLWRSRTDLLGTLDSHRWGDVWEE